MGETTPEEAHKIGMELAGAVLGGKYEFVLTTHVDKDHLHNHLIFNAVSFVDYKKYHSNKQSYHFIRRTSDRICKEHGLSVVVPGQDKGKSYAEYTAEKQGTSYKAKLKTAIDTLIPQVKDFDELLRRLQEMGYEIKQGKYISFRARRTGTVYPHKDARRGLYGRSDKGAYQGRVCCQNKNAAGR